MFNAEDMIKFANMKVADLKAELKKRGIKGYSKMKKAELQEKVLSIWEAEAEAEVQATDVVNAVPVEEVNAEEVNELKYRIEELEYDVEQRDEELAELSQLSQYINNNKSFTKKMMKDLARIYHPDKCGNAEDMIKLNGFKEAFKV